MINFVVGAAVGYGLALYAPARNYITSTAKKIFAYFVTPKE